MDKKIFIVEQITSEGNAERIGILESENNLLNDRDLNVVAKQAVLGTNGVIADGLLYKPEKKGSYMVIIMVRPQYDFDFVYYLDNDGYWSYGLIKSAEIQLKQRI